MGDNIDKLLNRFSYFQDEEEYENIRQWLHEDHQFRRILLYGVRYLGEGATSRDAEAAWNTFYIETNGLCSVIGTYNPNRGVCFYRYILICFRNSCFHQRKKIKRQNDFEKPLEMKTQTDEGGFIEIEIIDYGVSDDPYQAMEEKEKWDIIGRAIKKCINKLRPKYRRVIVMFYFEKKSIVEIAAELGISQVNVRVRLYRGRAEIRMHFYHLCTVDPKLRDVLDQEILDELMEYGQQMVELRIVKTEK